MTQPGWVNPSSYKFYIIKLNKLLDDFFFSLSPMSVQ